MERSDPMGDEFEPYISPGKDIAEFSIKAILVGILITIVMGAANAYLGPYVGMTVSATIPSMVFALAILKPFKGTILEINMAKNIGVAGEALAAGIIFTFPALIIINREYPGAGWDQLFTLERMLIIILVSLVGGLLGILFTIPLRKVFIDDLDLPYPEGVAAAEVLKTMEKGGRGIYYILLAAGIGGGMKFASSSGLSLWKEEISGVIGSGRARLFAGVNISPALLGVGYIIGPKIALIVFTGGILGWVIGIPVYGFFFGWPVVEDPDLPAKIASVMEIWDTQTKWIGIGAVLTGGVYTLWSMRKPLIQSIKETVRGKKGGDGGPEIIRTERDFHVSPVYLVVIFIAVAGLYLFITKSVVISPILAVLMFIATFLFTAVAGYLAGIVGSSNNPISSVTILTLMVVAFVLLGMNAVGISTMSIEMGMTATILVAAVVCCSAAIAGDSMQELKTAQILGATPIRIQWGRFIGVAVGAIVIPFIVGLLASAFVIGKPSGLPAPQAVIMGSTVVAIFTGEFNYIMFGIGMVLAAGLIFTKLPVMAVAIGIYLPFTLTTPIFIGGMLCWVSERFVVMKTRMYDTVGLAREQVEAKIKDAKDRTFNVGLLFAAGLVAGEAITGVIVAAIIISPLDIRLISNPSAIPGIFGLVYLMLLIVYFVIRDDIAHLKTPQILGIFSKVFKR